MGGMKNHKNEIMPRVDEYKANVQSLANELEQVCQSNRGDLILEWRGGQ
jgi:phage host-nuclease inhibitor protein Gam